MRAAMARLMYRFGFVREHLGFHPRVRGFAAGLVEQHHQHDPLEVVEVELVLVERHGAIEDEFALVGVENAVLFEEQQEAAALDIELVELRTEVDAGGAVGARSRRAGALRCQRVQPFEGLVDLRRTEAGLAELLEERTAAERIVVADEVGVLGELVFEQVQQDVQNALFHFPRPAPLTARWAGWGLLGCRTNHAPADCSKGGLIDSGGTGRVALSPGRQAP